MQVGSFYSLQANSGVWKVHMHLTKKQNDLCGMDEDLANAFLSVLSPVLKGILPAT